jgi:hypothetical protein
VLAAIEGHTIGDWSVSFALDDDERPCEKVAVTSTSRWRGLTLDAASKLEPDMRLDPPAGLDTPDKRRDWAAVKLAQLRNPSAAETESIGDWFVLFMLDDDGQCTKAAATPTHPGQTLDTLLCDDSQTWLDPPEGLDTPDKRRDWAAVRLAQLRAH